MVPFCWGVSPATATIRLTGMALAAQCGNLVKKQPLAAAIHTRVNDDRKRIVYKVSFKAAHL